MKKIASILLLCLFAFSIPVHATEIEPEGTPMRKLQRGFLNVVLFPIDIAHELHVEMDNDSFIPSWVIGLGRGIGFAAGRAVVGVYEMVTFPFPVPAHYEPLVYPEFVWEHLNEK